MATISPAFGWITAAIGAGAAAWGLLTGRIPMRWGRFVDRRKTPIRYWTSIGSLAVLFLLGLWIALMPPAN
jgi:hypothetical protein